MIQNFHFVTSSRFSAATWSSLSALSIPAFPRGSTSCLQPFGYFFKEVHPSTRRVTAHEPDDILDPSEQLACYSCVAEQKESHLGIKREHSQAERDPKSVQGSSSYAFIWSLSESRVEGSCRKRFIARHCQVP